MESERGLPAIIVAAGASRRMGTAKALLPWRGKPLVRYLCETLSEGGASVVLVVVGPDGTGTRIQEAIADLSFARCVINPSPERGMLSSVQAGMLSLNPDTGFLVCPCDLPNLKPEHVRVVIEAGNTCSDCVVVPVQGGKRGHPTFFGGKFRAEIQEMDPEQFGLNELLRRYPARVKEAPVTSDAIWRDTDTPEEWQQIKQEE